MTNPKGTAFESTLVPKLREYYPDADRRVRGGSKDKGDFLLPGERRFTIEAKNVRAMSLSTWLKEAEVEAANLGVPFGVVVHKRRGVTAPGKQYVTLELDAFLELTKQ